MILAALLWLAAYFVASIPFGILVARARGIDIRAQGSGNIGATNVGRVLGRKWGLFVLALDALKGAVPVLAAGWLTHRPGAVLPAWGLASAEWVQMGTGVAAVLGSVLPIYVGFKGGKAVGTSLGVVLAVPGLRLAGLAALLTFGLVRKLSGYVSLGSLCAAACLPTAYAALTQWGGAVFGRAWTGVGSAGGVPAGPAWPHARPFLILALALAAVVSIRHRANIARLLAGTEPRSHGENPK